MFNADYISFIYINIQFLFRHSKKCTHVQDYSKWCTGLYKKRRDFNDTWN